MTDFKVFLPLSKIDKEKRTVSGYASTQTKDSDGEIVSLDAIRKALPGYMSWANIREMHRLSAVGTAQEANIDEKGLFLTARITDDAAWKKCVEGVYKGFSIGGRKLAKIGAKVTEIDMTEISIVDRPANPDCRISLAKRQKDLAAGDEGFLLKLSNSRSPQTKALQKMAEAVDILAKAANNPPAAHDGFSLPAGPEPGAAISVNDARPEENITRKTDDDAVPCIKHGKIGCKKCAVAKRDFSASERREAAGSGAAMSDGSFPIKSAKDLDNAYGLRNNSKHSKSEVKSHIQSRARTLGLPDPYAAKDAKKAKKLAKRQRQVEVVAAIEADVLGKARNLSPPEVTPPAPQDWFLDLEAKPEALRTWKYHIGADLGKGMSAAGSLAYTFDSLRNAQRSLMLEGQREGGDKHDHELAKRLGALAKELAAIIGQKAEHEGSEAENLSDADDQYVTQSMGKDFAMTEQNGDLIKALVAEIAKRAAAPMTKAQRVGFARENLKKAKDCRKAARGAIEDCHKLHKAAYLAKAAKAKPDEKDGEFDHADAMEKLHKAHEEIEKMKTFMKAADSQLAKAVARSGQQGQETTDGDDFFTVPVGVKNLSPAQIAGAGPGTKGGGGQPPEYPDDGSVYSGKAEGAGGVNDLAKFVKDGLMSAEVAQLLIEKAQSEGALQAMRQMPVPTGRGQRPFAFDMTKVAGGTNDAEKRQQSAALFKGVDMAALQSDDEETHRHATALVLGNLLTNPGMAKSVFDSKFHGTAGF